MAAENDSILAFTARLNAASMRPRRMAAENTVARGPDLVLQLRFNEAAANGRGKHALFRRERYPTQNASMRPRRMAAENALSATMGAGHGRPASMRPRRMAAENLRSISLTSSSMPCFNEAAANGRGKRR